MELLAWFRRNAPSLGELYEGAVKMLFENTIPGRTRFIAHAVRDIRNRLPEVISGLKGGARFEWKQHLDELTDAWQKAGFSLDSSLPVTMTQSGTSSDSRSSNVTLPPHLFRRIAKMLEEYSRTRETRRSAAIRLFEGCAPENKQQKDALEPIVSQWMDITEWFVNTVHDSGQPDGDYDCAEFTRHFLLFEDTLIALLGQFFTTIKGLDEILEDTNS
ncbi:MAG: hypothetical protein AB1411_03010 [Nitrospirota bacterium]